MARVFIANQAEKDFDKLPSIEKKKIRKKLNLLENNPLTGKKLSGKLEGFYSLKAWPYRIIYFIKKNEIWVIHILHRQEAYK